MGKRSDYKKYDSLSEWDLDAGCRRIIDQSTPANRRLRDRLRRQARKKLNRRANDALGQDVVMNCGLMPTVIARAAERRWRGMDKLEMVIKGLECCAYAEDCADCPFEDHNDIYSTCIKNLSKAVMEMIMPRVLAIEEIHRGMAVWLEDIDKLDVILAIGGSSISGAKGFITVDDRSIAPLDDDYGKRWRAWTREPTDEQRKATPWES